MSLGVLTGLGVWRITRIWLPLAQTPLVDRVALGSALIAGLLAGGMLAVARLPLAVMACALLVSGLLAALSVIDLATRRLPNVLVAALFVVGLVHPLVRITNWRMMLTGAAFGAVMFGLLGLLGRGALGAGDVKLAIAIGAVLGLPAAIWGLVLGILAGGLGAILLLVTRSATRKDKMAYGPYLAAGAWVTYMAMLGVW
jgi:leader peptidase (prepilin peptidase)/N-methyltransferase